MGRPSVWDLINQKLGIRKPDPKEMGHLGDTHWWDLGRGFALRVLGNRTVLCVLSLF